MYSKNLFRWEYKLGMIYRFMYHLTTILLNTCYVMPRQNGDTMEEFCEIASILLLGPLYESIMYHSCCFSNKYNQILRIKLIGRRIIAYKGLQILIEIKLGRKIELTLRKVH